MAPVVVDASAVVAALVDRGCSGRWAESVLTSHHLAAPQHMPVEVAAILRRLARNGAIPADTASLAHDDLLALRTRLYPYAPFGPRVWRLRSNVTPYDGWYVALAEQLGAALATLDERLARTPLPLCRFLTPST